MCNRDHTRTHAISTRKKSNGHFMTNTQNAFFFGVACERAHVAVFVRENQANAKRSCWRWRMARHTHGVCVCVWVERERVWQYEYVLVNRITFEREIFTVGFYCWRCRRRHRRRHRRRRRCRCYCRCCCFAVTVHTQRALWARWASSEWIL